MTRCMTATAVVMMCSTLGFAEDGFKPLFNGKDLSGWVHVNTPPQTWSVKDGMLLCTGKPIGELRTERMYQNFIMEVEWRHMVPRGNAGIFVWGDDITAKGVPFHRSIEVQVLENAYGNSRGHTTHGDIFPIHGAKMTPINGRGGSRAFPTENRSKPSPEWNHYRIECRDGAISLAVNGKVVTRGKDCSPRKGYICLESEGGVVHYRNMRIKVLPDTPIDEANIAIANRGYRSNYTGLDLAGWTAAQDVLPHWKSNDWVLSYDGKSKAEHASLKTTHTYTDVGFVVDVRLKSEDSSAQILPRGSNIAIAIDRSNPAHGKLIDRPGRWNRIEGTLRGNRISATLNGKPIFTNELLKDASKTGPLTLIPHGAVDFANIYTRNLHQPPNPKPRPKKSESDRLQSLFDDEWDRQMRESPTWASHLGDLRFNDRWADLSPAAFARRKADMKAALKRLNAINASEVSEADRLNITLFRKEYESELGALDDAWYLMPLNQRGGIQDANSTADSLPFETVKHYEDWIARMRAFPQRMDQTIALMKKGIEIQRLHPKVVMKRVPAQIKRQIVDDPEDSLFFKPFRSFPAAVSAVDQQRLKREAANSIREAVVPAFRRLQAFFDDEYLPACFDEVGIWQMPHGQQLYASRTQHFTTTDMTPREIHDIGQAEVKRIRAEMESIVRDLKFEGSFPEFLEHLRTDPKFYYKDPNKLIAAYREFCKQVDPQLPRLFKRLPRVSYGIEAIPMNLAPDTTTAYYRRPSSDGRRPGTYFVNLYKPEIRPKYEIAALSLHEAVPGHHLQIALAMEQDGLPRFRRYGGYTAYIEGWALYAEKLGEQMGVYDDPYSKFGQLTYEMWRAVRLVVDTGMHSMKWSRQQAIDFFAANTAKTLHDIENEIDRYIAWPGQALAYKIGELKIRELRALAEEQHGNNFDIREFHDVILRNGAVPLDVLEAQVRNWLRKSKRP